MAESMTALSGLNRATVICLVFGGLLVLEHLFPLRPKTQKKSKRVMLNLTAGIAAAISMRLIFIHLTRLAADFSTTREIGVTYYLGLSPLLRVLVALLALDYTLYIWHQLVHRVPFLWRFHHAHHIDFDMDASTAFRFHVGELGISAFFRALQIVVIGLEFQTLVLFETLVLVFTQFHHANLRLPCWLERTLRWCLVTPEMHGVHHSQVLEETDSNYGTILSCWDRLHRSFKDIPSRVITIGVPAYRDPKDNTFLGFVRAPFQKPRAWPENMLIRRPQATDVTGVSDLNR